MLKDAKAELKKKLADIKLKSIRPWVYPGTYAVIMGANMMAEDVDNRSSASWKKAEHVFFDNDMHDGGKAMLPYWLKFQKSNPDGAASTQSMYVPVGGGVFVKYDASGKRVAKGTVEQLFA